jgi:D-arabinitol dehydrogenase (NADP+)
VQAIVFEGGSRWDVQAVPDPEPGPGQLRLKLLATGVCGTDQHLLDGGFIASFPLIPGHEMLGEVETLGDGVLGPAVGTRVVVDNTRFCGRCRPCRRGNPLYCEQFVSLGCNAPGGFAEYVVVSAHACYPVDDLPALTAVLTEPTACAMHGVDVLGLSPASDVLIFGAGPTGLLMSQLLMVGGAARVTVAAPTAAKLELARSFGVAETVLMDRRDPELAAGKLHEIASHGFDAIVEATGSVAVLNSALPLLTMGGTLLVYGLAEEAAIAAIRPYDVFSRELSIKGSFAQAHCFDRAVLALRSGRVRTEGIVSDLVSIDGFATALDNLKDSSRVKTVVELAGVSR